MKKRISQTENTQPKAEMQPFQANEELKEEKGRQSDRNAFTILLVDDTPENLIALEILLEEEGRTILKERNGKDTIKCVLNNQVDLILLDVNMPGMDGYEVAEVLKSNEITKHTPIIFVTAQMKEQNHVLKGYKEGAIDYLIKPLDPQVTRSKVKAFQQLVEEKGYSQPFSSAFDDYIFVKSGAKYVKVSYNDILWFEAEGDYVLIHTAKEKYMVHSTMKALEPKLPSGFLRIHRSFIVNIKYVKSIHDYVIQVNGQTLAIGKSYQQKVMEQLHKL